MNTINLKNLVAAILKEDIGRGDITTKALVKSTAKVQADIIAKQAGVICGLAIVKEIFHQLDPRITCRLLVRDGQTVKANTIVLHLYGSADSILAGERVALNCLSLLSGIATTTKRYVTTIKPYKAQILDTRKTIPLLREWQRYAVVCGGGVNHRFDLSTMAMIKDNHRQMTTRQHMTLTDAVSRIQKKYPAKKIELEIDSIHELDEALATKADIILLDNMSVVDVKKSVLRRNQLCSKKLLEASGGITLSNVKSYAKTGIDRISIGALTHHINALDMSLDILYHA